MGLLERWPHAFPGGAGHSPAALGSRSVLQGLMIYLSDFPLFCRQWLMGISLFVMTVVAYTIFK